MSSIKFGDTNVELSVIIVSYKNESITLDCIRSIRDQNDIGAKLEVILVDNSPSHNVYDVVAQNHPDVICLKNENNGFGGGNNVGAAVAKGRYLLFLNPDTILVEPIFNFAIQQFHKNEKLVMFGVKLVGIDLRRNASFYLLSGGGFMRDIIEVLCNKMDLFINGRMYTSGANIFVRSQAFIGAGKFDEEIFMYYEEPDLTRRLLYNGGETAYFRKKRVVHLEGGTTQDIEVALRRRLDSAIYYNKKYNIDPVKQLIRERRVSNFKLGLSGLWGDGNSYIIKKKIEILQEYIDKLEKMRRL